MSHDQTFSEWAAELDRQIARHRRRRLLRQIGEWTLSVIAGFVIGSVVILLGFAAWLALQ